MTDVKYITNHHWRNLTYGYELTQAERANFDYIEDEEFDMHNFLRYRGRVYDVDEFMRTDDPAWDGFLGDSFFSGIAIKLSEDGEHAQVALVLS